MTLLTSEMKMAEVIHHNYLLIPVISRFGIRLGFGEKTVKTVCDEHQINSEFFLAIINTFNNENFFPEKKLQTFNIMVILKYLRKTHSSYLDSQVPAIEKNIDILISSGKNPSNNLKLVKNFFLTYKKELGVHISREETLVFPYIEKIYKLYHQAFNAEEYHETIKKYSINKFEEEHDNIDDKLCDLQNILIKYITDSYDEVLCNIVISQLFSLEKDIKDHTRLEDNVLIPLVAEMENELKLKNR
jgi:regulator of cell morphogenesis and NO signaling